MKNLLFILFTILLFSCSHREKLSPSYQSHKPAIKPARIAKDSIEPSEGMIFRTIASGYFHDTSIFEKKVNGSWKKARAYPDSTNPLFIEAGTTLFLDTVEWVKDIHFNTSTGQRLNTGSYKLYSTGKARLYSGDADNSMNDMNNAGSPYYITGELWFYGRSSRTIIHQGEFSAHGHLKWFKLGIDFGDSSNIATIDESIRAGWYDITGKLIVAGPNSLRPAGNGETDWGSIHLRTNSVLIGGHFYKSSTDAFQDFYAEAGSRLHFQYPGRIFAAKNHHFDSTARVTGYCPIDGDRPGAAQLPCMQ